MKAVSQSSDWDLRVHRVHIIIQYVVLSSVGTSVLEHGNTITLYMEVLSISFQLPSYFDVEMGRHPSLSEELV